MDRNFNKIRVKNESKTSIEDKEIEELTSKSSSFDWSQFDSFDSIPLSRHTLNGLNKNHFTKPTDIQKQTIGLGLCGEDVLGAAKTGSGKTLAFLVPVLECLYRNKWTQLDGIGALVITPTRELSYQIFDVLRKVGEYHELSAALVIGGKDLKFEQKRMDKCNIVICTPGRLLDHMDQNPLFSCDNLKILVLDEADKCLDMGFADTMNAIIANLPQRRQTFLFSATQTKSVKDLARLSLKHPKYVSVHETSQYSTPDSLVQSYIVCELNDKINMLWSFIKTHLHQKILVFMATCKQVKYAHELFCRMRPGMSLLALYGSLHQLKRMAIYDEFVRKHNVIMFATDIASRGLDFPSVNWVIQLDCPEDVNTYIHRVGRTARYEQSGESLLVFLPNEEDSMVKQLTDKKIPINMISVNETKMYYIQRKAEAMCARDKNLKESAQRAFKAYIKNVFLMKDKSVFNVEFLNFDLYARSLGLAVTPRVRFVEKSMKSKLNANKSQMKNVEQNYKPNTDRLNFEASDSEAEKSETELFSVKKVWRFDLDDENGSNDDIVSNQIPVTKLKKAVTKAALVKKILKRKFQPNSRIVFDDEGVVTNGEFPTRQVSDKIKMLDEKGISGIDIETAKQIMKDEDLIDKNLYRNKVKEMHKQKRLKLKEEKRKKREERSVTAFEESDEDFNDVNDVTNRFIDELPDPDVVYENESNDDEDYNNDVDIEDNKQPFIDNSRKNSSKHKNTNHNIFNKDLGLEECEELANYLINS